MRSRYGVCAGYGADVRLGLSIRVLKRKNPVRIQGQRTEAPGVSSKKAPQGAFFDWSE
eukprot:CAMPEP_0184407136 /NCGR_PEP_ID=MMETSP0738-20130409/2191_1 /TAXON_ID=385413 /ORGANISM="Thalassiosira miniscula, Strain CCMP1093" /LENGTH=57 /DNA_ID=CAMNT_0026764233 /DNA_START=1 /DNA_END=174 /DNA_ORIENTATION=+